MSFSLFRRNRLRFAGAASSSVSADADEIMRAWGAAAYDRATELSSQEDMGFISSPSPGHWWSVRREIGRRLGQRETEPAIEFAA